MKSTNDHIRGLDSIRFVCALWVVFSHFGGPILPAWVDKGTPLGWVIHGIYANIFSGPAAVIVFFVVSGFCIHYSNREDLRVSSLISFYIRRFVRILIPMVAATYIWQMMGFRFKILEHSILWSLFAELIYYSIYPALLIWRRRHLSWRPVIAVSFVLALSLVVLFPYGLGGATPGDYPVYGIWLNWLLGLPCWLIGCAVAEAASATVAKPRHSLWILRLAILGAASVCSVLRFHTSVGYPWTLNFFAIFVGYWLLQEIHTPRRSSRVSALLEWAGTWSYSLYLTHGIGRAFFLLFLGSSTLVGGNLAWLAQALTILILAIVFAYVFEFSAHRLARSLARRFAS